MGEKRFMIAPRVNRLMQKPTEKYRQTGHENQGGNMHLALTLGHLFFSFCAMLELANLNEVLDLRP